MAEHLANIVEMVSFKPYKNQMIIVVNSVVECHRLSGNRRKFDGHMIKFDKFNKWTNELIFSPGTV
jgi:hypothetical protein